MLKFIQNKDGFLGLTLSSVGLFIAVAVLLAAVFNFVFMNDWGKEEEMKSMVDGFSSHIDGMDSCFFDNKTKYFFKNDGFDYSVEISTEYIVMDSSSGWFDDEEIRVNKRLVTNVLPRDNRFRWKTGDEFHNYLKNKYTYSGAIDDPVENKLKFPSTVDYITLVKSYISDVEKITEEELAENPLIIDADEPVFVEKVYIYYDNDADGIWDSEIDSRQPVLLLYQK